MKLSANIMALIAVAMLALIGWQSWQEGTAARLVSAQAELERAEAEKQEAINELVEDSTFWLGMMCFAVLLFCCGLVIMMYRMFLETQRQRDIREDKAWSFIYEIIGEKKAEMLDDETQKEVLSYEKLVNIQHETEVAR